MLEVYQPEEDSYLLAEEVKKYISSLDNKSIEILDMGSGTGIQALTAIKSGAKKENVLCADINKFAVKELKKENLKTVFSDLFEKIDKRKKFDLILFNPPYLPENKYDRQLDTTGGKRGYETIIKFLKQAKEHLEENGKILLLFSNLSKPNILKRKAEKLGYKYQKKAEKKLFFEKLFVYEFYIK